MTALTTPAPAPINNPSAMLPTTVSFVVLYRAYPVVAHTQLYVGCGTSSSSGGLRAGMDVLEREDLPFPRSASRVPATFPRMTRRAPPIWRRRGGLTGSSVPRCQTVAEPYRFTTRPGALACAAGSAVAIPD